MSWWVTENSLPPANEVARSYCFHRRMSPTLSTRRGVVCIPSRITGQYYISCCTVVDSQLVDGQHLGNIKCIVSHGTHPPWRQPTSGGRHPAMRLISMRYASYWNAFLLPKFLSYSKRSKIGTLKCANGNSIMHLHSLDKIRYGIRTNGLPLRCGRFAGLCANTCCFSHSNTMKVWKTTRWQTAKIHENEHTKSGKSDPYFKGMNTILS